MNQLKMPKLQASICEHIENEKTRKNINFFSFLPGI